MRTDILLGADGDLDMTNGDFSVGDGTQQSVMSIIQSQKGDWRQFPLVGVGLIKYIHQRNGLAPFVANVPKLTRDIKVNLEAAGFSDPQVTINSDLSIFQINVKQN